MVSTTTHSSSSVGYGVIRTASTPSFFHTLVLSHPRSFTPSFFHTLVLSSRLVALRVLRSTPGAKRAPHALSECVDCDRGGAVPRGTPAGRRDLGHRLGHRLGLRLGLRLGRGILDGERGLELRRRRGGWFNNVHGIRRVHDGYPRSRWVPRRRRRSYRRDRKVRGCRTWTSWRRAPHRVKRVKSGAGR